MALENQDIPVDDDERYVAGDSTRIVVDVVDDSGNDDSLPNVDTVKFALADYVGATPLVEKDSNSQDVQVADVQAGIIYVDIDGSETADLGTPSGRRYHYEVAVERTDGSEITVTIGEWTIYSDSVTIN